MMMKSEESESRVERIHEFGDGLVEGYGSYRGCEGYGDYRTYGGYGGCGSNASRCRNASPAASVFSDDSAVVVRSRMTESIFSGGSYDTLNNIAAETTQSFSRVEEQLKLLKTRLGITSSQPSRGDAQTLRPPESSISHSQVQDSELEINQRNNGSLGYRGMNVEDDDCFTVPKFDGFNPLAWIPKMERLFSISGYGDNDRLTLVYLYLGGDALEWFFRVMHRQRFKDWDEFKQQLLDRFGIVESRSTVEVNGKAESASINAASCETKMVKKLASPAVQEVSGDCSVHSSFSPDLRLKQDSFAHAVQEPEVMLQRHSFHEIDQKTIMRGEISVLDGVEKADSFLVNVPSCSLVKGKLTDELISCKESVHETGAVQELNSTSREETKEIYIPKAAEPSSFTNLVSSEASSVMLYPFINVKEDAESVKKFQVFPGMLQPSCDPRVSRVTSTHQQRPFYKTWKFKYKSGGLQPLRNRQLEFMKRKYMAFISAYMISQGKVVVVMQWFPRNRRPVLRGMIHFIMGDMKLHMLHKWKSKSGNFPSMSEHLTFQVIQYPLVHKIKHVSFTLRLSLQTSPATQKKSLLSQTLSYLQRYYDASNVSRPLFLQLGDPADSNVMSVNFTDMWSCGKWQTLLMYSLGWKVILVLLQNRFAAISGSRGSFQYQWIGRLRHYLRKFLTKGYSSIWHRWRYKTLECAAGLHCGYRLGSLQQHESFQESDPIIFFSSSLWSSLFSRAGVYESIHICLWIVAVLIWRYDREEKKESELLIQELFKVSSFLNRLFPQDNDMLLMQHEGNLLRVRVHQSHKKKKSFKTHMFYKQQLSNISAWTEVKQPNVPGAYVNVTSKEAGTLQSRDYGGLSACTSDRVINQFTSSRLLPHYIYGWWNDWSVYSGNKVMQQRWRSKMPKSWMFKYKEKVHVLSLANC